MHSTPPPADVGCTSAKKSLRMEKTSPVLRYGVERRDKIARQSRAGGQPYGLLFIIAESLAVAIDEKPLGNT